MKISIQVLIIILSLLKCFVDFHFVFRFVEVFFRPKQKNIWIYYIGTVISAVALFFINLIGSYTLNTIFMLTFIFIRCIILLKGNWRPILSISLIAFTIDLFCEFFTLALVNVLLQESQLLKSYNIQIICIVMNIIIYIFITYYLIKILKSKNIKIMHTKKYLFILPVTSIGSIYYIIYLKQAIFINETVYSNIVYIVVVIGLGFINIIALAIHDGISKKAALEQEIDKMHIQQLSTEITYKQQENNLLELRKISHDFKSHLICLSGLIHSNVDINSNLDIKEYIDNVIEGIDNAKFQNLNKSDNNALNIILFEKEQKCHVLKIKFKIEIDYSYLSFITYKDTCTIFANALDNAINACCLTLNSNIDPYINLRIFRVNAMLFIEICNSKVNSIVCSGTKVKSTKDSTKEHGYGLMNIKDALSHYNGSMDYTFTDNTFQLSLCVPIMNKV